jgi:hypothetical protein
LDSNHRTWIRALKRALLNYKQKPQYLQKVITQVAPEVLYSERDPVVALRPERRVQSITPV